MTGARTSALVPCKCGHERGEHTDNVCDHRSCGCIVIRPDYVKMPAWSDLLLKGAKK